MMYYLKANPDTMDDEQWSRAVKGLAFILDFDGKRLSNRGNMNLPNY